MALAQGVLHGETSGLVDEREGGVVLLVLDVGAEAHVLEPVLVLVAGVGGGEDDVAVADGEAVTLVGLAEDLEGGLVAAGGSWGVGRWVLAMVAVVTEAEHLRSSRGFGGGLDCVKSGRRKVLDGAMRNCEHWVPFIEGCARLLPGVVPRDPR